VTLSTTDPAAHLADALDDETQDGLQVERIDPATDVPDAVRELDQRLRDPQFAHVIIVTLAESTPVHEAQRLQADLRRAGIEPIGWLVNASLAQTATTHPTLLARARAERVHLDRVRHLSEHKTWAVAWQQDPPTGIAALRKIAGATPAIR